MDLVEVLGLAAAFLTTVANIPQAVKVVRTKSTKSLSARTYALLFIGLVVWVVYGFLEDDLPVILGNIVAGALAGLILFYKVFIPSPDEGDEEK